MQRSKFCSLLRWSGAGLIALALSSSAFAQRAHPAPQGAPEIDPGLASAALGLVIGGAIIYATLRRKKLSGS